MQIEIKPESTPPEIAERARRWAKRYVKPKHSADLPVVRTGSDTYVGYYRTKTIVTVEVKRPVVPVRKAGV